jgi:Uma2 family endonuclease
MLTMYNTDDDSYNKVEEPDPSVKEYWIVYPVEESVAVFNLSSADSYDGARLYAGKDKIESKSIPGLIIHLNDIFTN